jgi:hypothetical protein
MMPSLMLNPRLRTKSSDDFRISVPSRRRDSLTGQLSALSPENPNKSLGLTAFDHLAEPLPDNPCKTPGCSVAWTWELPSSTSLSPTSQQDLKSWLPAPESDDINPSVKPSLVLVFNTQLTFGVGDIANSRLALWPSDPLGSLVVSTASDALNTLLTSTEADFSTFSLLRGLALPAKSQVTD